MGFLSKIFGLGASPMPIYIERTTEDGTSSTVTPDNAMKIATVYSCVRIIAEDVGTLPIHVKRRTADGNIETLYGHPVAKLLRRPNPLMNGIDFRRAMIASLELRGNAYAHISERDRRGYPTRLDYIDPDTVDIAVGRDDVYYAVSGYDGLIPSRDMIHLKGYAPDGIEGKSPIRLQAEVLENAVNTTRFSKNIYKNDLKSTGVFTTEGKLSEESYARLKGQLAKAWARLGKTSLPLVLENGTKVTTLSITPEDAQFVTTKLLTIDEIAAIFRVPPHKVGDWTRGTYSNNTQANLEYFTDCVRPLLEVTEEEFDNKLFLEAEQGECYVEVAFKGLLRTDIKTQIENYRTMYNIGVYTPNEIRRMEDLPPYEGGDRYFVPVNMAVNDVELTQIKSNEQESE